MTTTINLRTESSGIRPMFEHAIASRRKAIQSPGSFRQRREKNERERRAFRLVWQDGREGQKYLLKQAWEDSLGGALTMNYTMLGDVDANAIEVSFISDSLIIARTGPVTWNMEVEVQEEHF